jgi:hypothetical protein
MRAVKDALLLKETALPAAASATVNGEAIDLGQGENVTPFDVVLELPELSTTELPDTKTLTTKIQDSADNSSFADLATVATVVQTGAGGAGAAAVSRRFALPSNARRYIRAVATAGADTTDMSAKDMTLDLAL